MSGPIKPSEVAAKFVDIVPEEVFEAVNELIAKNWNGSGARVLQKHVVALAIAKIQARDSTFAPHMFDYKWLNIEAAYRKERWKVDYDKPGYNEDYDASFTFTAPVTRG